MENIQKMIEEKKAAIEQLRDEITQEGLYDE